MAGRDDFGSNSRSPGGWGGSGSGSSMGGMGGQKASNYNYYSGAGQRGPAVGNWNTGGVPVRTGNQYGTNPMGYSRQPFPGGFAGNVVKKPVPALLGEPLPQTWTPAPPVTQEDIPGGMTLAEYYDSLTGTGPYIQKPTRPMAPNVYGQPPASPIPDRPPPSIYGPRTGTAAYNMDPNPVVPQGSQMGYNNLRNSSPAPAYNWGGSRSWGFN